MNETATTKRVSEVYGPMLDDYEPDWRDETPGDRDGAASLAVAVCMLMGYGFDKRRCAHFTTEELERAYGRLKDNGYVNEDEANARLVWDEETDIGDGIAWLLLMAVGQGYLERSPDGAAS